MMKFLLLLLNVYLLNVLMGMNEYVDLQRNFKVTVLDGYQISVVNNQNPFLYLGKDLVKGSYPNLNFVQAQLVPDDIFNNTDSIVNQLKNKLSNYSLLKKERFAFQDSKNGVKIYGSWILEGKQLKNIQYYFLMNNFLYIATGTSLADEFEKDLKFFDETVMSIKKLR